MPAENGGESSKSAGERLITSVDGIAELLVSARNVAVVGIKTEAQAGQPAFYVPEYLVNAGLKLFPVPVYYPDVTEILGQKVYRTVAEIPEAIDIAVLFRRPADVAGHVDDLLAASPGTVWMQSGIRNDAAALRLAEAGINVVQDRCIMIEHRRVRR